VKDDLGKPLVVLDLSCGTGFVAMRMAQQAQEQQQNGKRGISAQQPVRHVFALDYSKEMLSELVTSVQKKSVEYIIIIIIIAAIDYSRRCDGATVSRP
jgi:ubiquinone/menaquinone biosynthesis C-methylase UbiE